MQAGFDTTLLHQILVFKNFIIWCVLGCKRDNFKRSSTIIGKFFTGTGECYVLVLL